MGGRSPGQGGLKLRVLSFGKDRSGLFAPAVEEYVARLSHYVALEVVELAAGRSKAEEATALFDRLDAREKLVALDERGEAWTTLDLARFLDGARRDAWHLTWVVGGDEGLDGSVHERADRVLQLSAFTLPHRLARLVLLEQLYRAFTVLRGEPYHK